MEISLKPLSRFRGPLLLSIGIVRASYDSCNNAALLLAFGRPRFFGAGGVLSIARTASSKLPLMGGTIVSPVWRFGIS